MAEYVAAAKVGEIKPGEMKLLKMNGKEFMLANVDGDFLAFTNLCPHAECRLDEDGVLEKDELECACHGSRFSLRSGAVISEPASDQLTLYPVQVVGDEVRVRLDGQ